MVRLSRVLGALTVGGLLILSVQRTADGTTVAAEAIGAPLGIAPNATGNAYHANEPSASPWQPTGTPSPSLPPGKRYRPTYGPPSDQFIDLGWIDAERGWALVAALCGHAHERCPEVYGTQNGGRTWHRLASAGSLGCSKATACAHTVRFVTPRIGYLYGPALFMTMDGGRVWTRRPEPPVESLAFSGSEVFRLVFQGSGCPGPCHPSLQRSQPGDRPWITLPRWRDASQGFGEQLLASGANLYTVFYGHIAGGAGSAHATIELSHDRGRSWEVHHDPCGYTGPHEEDASAAAASGSSLGILCVSRGGQGPNFVAFSCNAGRTFTASAPLHVTAPEQIAVDAGCDIAVGNGGITGGGRFVYELALSRKGGQTWRIAIRDREQVAEDLAGGALQFVSARDLSWVGYPYRVWQSFDGGQTWHTRPAP